MESTSRFDHERDPWAAPAAGATRVPAARPPGRITGRAERWLGVVLWLSLGVVLLCLHG